MWVLKFYQNSMSSGSNDYFRVKTNNAQAQDGNKKIVFVSPQKVYLPIGRYFPLGQVKIKLMMLT